MSNLKDLALPLTEWKKREDILFQNDHSGRREIKGKQTYMPQRSAGHGGADFYLPNWLFAPLRRETAVTFLISVYVCVSVVNSHSDWQSTVPMLSPTYDAIHCLN